MLEIEKKYHATFENAIMHRGKIFFTDYDSPRLFVYDGREEVTMLAHLPGGENQKRAYGTICAYEDCLYVASFNAEGEIYKCNINNGEFEKIDISERSNSQIVNNGKFFNSYVVDNKIYFVGGSFLGIIIYDPKKKECVIWDNWIKDVLSLTGELDGKVIFRRTILINKKIVAPMCNNNTVFIFDLNSQEYGVFQIGEKGDGFSAICFDGEFFWLAPRNEGEIIKWDAKTNQLFEFSNYPEGYIRKAYSTSDIFVLNDKVIITPMESNMILEVNRFTGKIKEYKKEFRGFRHIDVTCFKKKVLICVKGVNAKLKSTVYLIDKDTEEIEEMPFIYSNDDAKYLTYEWNLFHNRIENNNRIMYERYNKSLDDFLDYIKTK